MAIVLGFWIGIIIRRSCMITTCGGRGLSLRGKAFLWVSGEFLGVNIIFGGQFTGGFSGGTFMCVQ